MTTFTIATSGPYTEGQPVMIHGPTALPTLPPGGRHTLVGTILRVSDHELLVRVGGRNMAFQRHDGESWSWTEWEQGEMDVGDEQRRLV